MVTNLQQPHAELTLKNGLQGRIPLEMVNELGTAGVQSDSELVRRCIEGEEAAWTQLIQRYDRLVSSVARALCPNPDDTADVFQSACLDLYKGLPKLRDVQALPAWLITVTRRRAYTLMKPGISSGDRDVEEQSGTDADTILQIEREHALELALEQLPDRCRELIDLLYFNVEQPSYADISEKLSIPVASIGPTRARCLDKLKKLLG